jgi:hypothetical protein
MPRKRFRVLRPGCSEAHQMVIRGYGIVSLEIQALVPQALL